MVSEPSGDAPPRESADDSGRPLSVGRPTVFRMEKWEALMVRLVPQPEDRSQLEVIGPDGNTRVVPTEGAATINRVLQLVAELGDDGWKLVSTEQFESNVRLFWLTRQKPEEPAGGWVYSV